MLKKRKKMCDAMMDNMGSVDAMMTKGKSRCQDMMSFSHKIESNSCEAETYENDSCSANKTTPSVKNDEYPNDGSCKL